MNLVGKIFTVLILVMSILFMGFAMMVYATHKNWSEEASKLDNQLVALRSENNQLKDEITIHQNALSHERAARRTALARLESQVQEKQDQFEARNSQYTELLAKQRENTEKVVAAQRAVEQMAANVTKLEDEVRKARADRDTVFARVRELTDQMHQAEGIKRRLERRYQELQEDYATAQTVLKANDLNIHTPVSGIPPRVRAEVLEVADDLIEVSVGTDDGIKQGNTFVVSRGERFLARAEVIRVTPDRSVGRIVYRNASIREGDRVQTKVEIR